jgi:hypothetical protein
LDHQPQGCEEISLKIYASGLILIDAEKRYWEIVTLSFSHRLPYLTAAEWLGLKYGQMS